jgi:methylphosphotriester-DNA--protein-cysteine methyltransferase
MRKTKILIVALLLLCCLGCSSQRYIGSRSSDKYHKPSCRWAESINSTNRVYFKNPEEAEHKGYEPCKTCKP